MLRSRALSSTQVRDWLGAAIPNPSAPVPPPLGRDLSDTLALTDVAYAGVKHLADTLALSDSVTKTIIPPALLPSDVSGLHHWFDASDASTFTYSSGVVVSQWNDKSGAGRHLTQATVSNQPSRNGTQNGLTTVVFDGTADYMDTPSFTLAQPFTVFMALSATDVVSGWLGAVGGTGLIVYYSGPGNYPTMYAGSVNPGYDSIAGAHLWTFTFNGASSNMHRDGVAIGPGDAGTNGTTTGFRTAHGTLARRIVGPLYEVVTYNRVLTTTERQGVESGLRTKWGLP